MADIVSAFPTSIAMSDSGVQRVAEAYVYAASDTSLTTPLAITDMQGIPITGGKLTTTTGQFPQFKAPAGVTQVLVLSGGRVTLLTDVSVYVGAAVESATAAATSAGASEQARVLSAAAKTLAEQAAAAAAAVGATTDTQIESRIKDPASKTAAAILAVVEPPLLPQNFGADDSGVNDSRAAIQAAINAASAAGGGQVLIDGTFRIDAPLTPRSNVHIIGRGWGRSIIKPSATWNNGVTGSVLEVGGSAANPIANFFVSGIKFDLSSIPDTVQAKGLFVTYMRNLRFENNWVYRSTATGIGADFLDGGVIRGNRVEECGRYAEGQEDARLGCSGIGIGTGAWGTEATLVEGNFIYRPVRYGIFVEYQRGISQFFTQFVKILNNHIEGAHWGIGSDGVAWATIAHNSVIDSTLDGITLTVGNAGALSYGDLIAFNRVKGSGRYGIRLDATQDGVTPTRRGHWRIIGNDIWGSTSVGIKFESAPVIPHVKINDNSIFENGSIGIDITGGGLSESEILRNRIVDNNGRGIRLLANALTRVKIAGNRSGDTRTTGRTQTHGIDIQDQSKLDQVDIVDNDFRNNTAAAIGASGTLDPAKSNTMVRNKGVGPDVVDALTVSASPMTYQVGARPEKLWAIGGTWTNIQINGQTVLTSPGSVDVEPNDVVTFTYTAAPTAIKRRKL